MFGFDPRVAKATWTVVFIALLLFVLYTTRLTLLVVIFAVFFAYLVYPLVQFVERHGGPRLPRAAAITIAFVFVVAIVVSAVLLVGERIGEEATSFAQRLPMLLSTANLTESIRLPGFLEPFGTHLQHLLGAQLQAGSGLGVSLLHRLGTSVVHLISNLLYVVLIPILSFLLINDAPEIRAEVLSWADDTNSVFWRAVARDMHLLLTGFVRALLLLSLATFISYSIVFSTLRVPYALFLAAISAVLEFIPVIGPLTSAGLVMGISVITGYGHLLWLAGFFIAYRIFQDYVLSPYLMSEQVALPPLLVIVGVIAGEQLGGVSGIFLSIPALAALKVLLRRARHFSRKRY